MKNTRLFALVTIILSMLGVLFKYLEKETYSPYFVLAFFFGFLSIMSGIFYIINIIEKNNKH